MSDQEIEYEYATDSEDETQPELTLELPVLVNTIDTPVLSLDESDLVISPNDNEEVILLEPSMELELDEVRSLSGTGPNSPRLATFTAITSANVESTEQETTYLFDDQPKQMYIYPPQEAAEVELGVELDPLADAPVELFGATSTEDAETEITTTSISAPVLETNINKVYFDPSTDVLKQTEQINVVHLTNLESEQNAALHEAVQGISLEPVAEASKDKLHLVLSTPELSEDKIDETKALSPRRTFGDNILLNSGSNVTPTDELDPGDLYPLPEEPAASQPTPPEDLLANLNPASYSAPIAFNDSHDEVVEPTAATTERLWPTLVNAEGLYQDEANVQKIIHELFKDFILNGSESEWFHEWLQVDYNEIQVHSETTSRLTYQYVPYTRKVVSRGFLRKILFSVGNKMYCMVFVNTPVSLNEIYIRYLSDVKYKSRQFGFCTTSQTFNKIENVQIIVIVDNINGIKIPETAQNVKTFLQVYDKEVLRKTTRLSSFHARNKGYNICLDMQLLCKSPTVETSKVLQ